MKRIAPVIRLLLALALALGMARGMEWYWGHAERELEWRAAESDSLEAFLALDGSGRSPAFHLARARALSERLFPPRNGDAAASIQRAMALDPTDSAAWTRLASCRQAEGDTTGAARALTLADALDPLFPDQRLQSMRVWTLLGRRDEALRIAKSIAHLNPEVRAKTVDEIVWGGATPGEVWRELALDRTPDDELDELVLHLAERGLLGPLLSERNDVPARWLGASTLRPALAEGLSRPLCYDLLRRVVSAAMKGKEALHLDPGLVFEPDLGLAENPLAGERLFGWRRGNLESALSIRYWTPAALDAGVRGKPEGGAVAVSSLLAPGVAARAEVFRFVAPPDTDTTLTLAVYEPTADSAETEFFLCGEGASRRTPGPRAPAAWEAVSFFTPATAGGQVLRLETSLKSDRAGRAQTFLGTASLEFGDKTGAAR